MALKSKIVREKKSNDCTVVYKFYYQDIYVTFLSLVILRGYLTPP